MKNCGLGATLNLSGQIYTENGRLFTNTCSVSCYSGASGSITKGVLSLSIGIPDRLESILHATTWDYVYDDLTFTPDDVKARWLRSWRVADNSSHYSGLFLGRRKETSNLFKDITYLYVDKDVTVTGKGKTVSGIIIADLELNLKTGWNAIYSKKTTTTYCETVGDIASIKWIIWEK